MRTFIHRTRSFIIMGLLLGIVSGEEEEFNKSGRTALQFLKLGVGARETALGEACTALSRGANAAFWNPASIEGVGRLEATFTYSHLYADMDYMASAFGFRLNRLGTFAVSFARLDYGDITEAFSKGQGGTYDPRIVVDDKYRTFTGGDLLVGLSFARAVSDRLSIGFTAKYLSETLFTYQASTYAFDMGTYYDTGFRGLRIAMSAQNFGGRPVEWLEKSAVGTGYDIPLYFKFGASINLIDAENGLMTLGKGHKLQLGLEAINTNDYGERYHYGLEYWFMDFLALRGGYRQNYAEGNVAFGFGLMPRVGDLDLAIDYSIVSYKYLAPPQRFTVSIHF